MASLLMTDLFDGICSKRLQAMDVEIRRLYCQGTMRKRPGSCQKLMTRTPRRSIVC